METKMIRAKITDADWQRARARALKLRIPVAQFVGQAIRDALNGSRA